MASITVSRPTPEQIAPVHLSLDGALLLSLIEPYQLQGAVIYAYDADGGLITVQSTPNGWFGDYRITAWTPLSVTAAEDHYHESLIEPDLIDPDDRLPLVHGYTVLDVADAEDIPAAMHQCREELLDKAAHAAASYVRRPVTT